MGDSQADNQAKEEEAPSQAKNDNNRNKKRRLSKKEQKALKKQKTSKNNDTASDVATLAAVGTTEENDFKNVSSPPNYLDDYKPIPVPSNKNLQDPIDHDGSHNTKVGEISKESGEGGGGDRSLGKWFPNALVIKSSVTYHNTISSDSPNKKKKKKKKKGQSSEKEEEEQVVDGNINVTPVSSSTKNIEAPKCSLVLFYQYATPPWSEKKVALLIRYLCNLGRERNLGGRIRVASEGVNATISSVTTKKDGDTTLMDPTRTIRHFTQDLINFDSATFSLTDFKYIDDLAPDRHFKELKILPVKELVYYGIKEKDAPLGEGGVHLDPVEYHEMLGRDDAVVIDVRNHYEADIGRFDGQMKRKCKEKATVTDDDAKKEKKNSPSDGSGAEYVDPLMRKSTDFPEWLSKPSTQAKLKDKTVLMYCTGGVRCERASAYLKSQIGNEVKGVYQLKGGIEKYLQTFKDGGYWTGKNFVFDKREAIGVGNVQGDGGVIRKTPAQQQQKKKKKKKQDTSEESEANGDQIQGKCCICKVPWDRYVGKKKCYTCGVPVLMCDSCMSKKPDKTPGMELSVRCPLCVKENITVPANEVEFTANGVRNKDSNSSEIKETNKKYDDEDAKRTKQQQEQKERKAAASVLKWGGGHAAKKKELRKMKRKLCQFGASCTREDCFFAHPDRIGIDVSGKGGRKEKA